MGPQQLNLSTEKFGMLGIQKKTGTVKNKFRLQKYTFHSRQFKHIEYLEVWPSKE